MRRFSKLSPRPRGKSLVSMRRPSRKEFLATYTWGKPCPTACSGPEPLGTYSPDLNQFPSVQSQRSSSPVSSDWAAPSSGRMPTFCWLRRPVIQLVFKLDRTEEEHQQRHLDRFGNRLTLDFGMSSSGFSIAPRASPKNPEILNPHGTTDPSAPPLQAAIEDGEVPRPTEGVRLRLNWALQVCGVTFLGSIRETR